MDASIDGDIRFEIIADGIRVQMVLELKNEEYQFKVYNGHQLVIRQGLRESTIQDFFFRYPPNGRTSLLMDPPWRVAVTLHYQNLPRLSLEKRYWTGTGQGLT